MTYLDYAATYLSEYPNPNAEYAVKSREKLKECEQMIKDAIGVSGGHVLYFRTCSDSARWLANQNWLAVNSHPECHDSVSFNGYNSDGVGALRFIPYVSHLTGKIYDVQSIAHDGSYVALDCTQAIGKIELDRNAMQYVDAVLMSGHKIGCPYLSFMWLSDRMCALLHADKDIRNQYGLVHGTLSVELVDDLADQLYTPLVKIPAETYVVRTYDYMVEQLSANGIKFSVIDDDKPKSHAINLIKLDGINADSLQQYCASNGCYIGICASACAAGKDRYRVANAMGLDNKAASQCIRVSFGVETYQSDIDVLVGLIKEFKEKFVV